MADHSDIGQRPVPGALFSMDAADNAEVLPTEPPRGPDAMWSTAANPEDAEEVVPTSQLPPPPSGGWSPPPPMSAPGPSHVLDDDEAWAQMGSPTPPPPPPAPDQAAAGAGFGVGAPVDPWSRTEVPPTPAGAPGAGGVFSAEPVERFDDVVDEDAVDGELEDDWVDPSSGASVFSSDPGVNGSSLNGSAGGVAPGSGIGGNGGGHRPGSNGSTAPFGGQGRGAGTAEARSGTPRSASPFGAPEDPWTPREHAGTPTSEHPGPAAPPPFVPPSPGAVFSGATQRRDDEDPAAAIAADQHGLDVAVSRLRTEDQERARVPLSVCGALLEPGEQVLGAVTGQMLGRPAAVVVTRTRVLVVNDRRWQPIVDIYPIDDTLLVRGRHDRQVAALSFADDQRLSMVDGITEVEIAIGLADAIRDPGMSDRGSGAAF